MDAWTYETMGEIISLCTGNSRTTDNRVIGRRHLPLSLLDTSIQLCPSVHLRVRCKAERSFFTEEDNLYIDCQKQRRFCLRTVASRYFTSNRTVRTCDKLQTAMSDVDVMSARFVVPKLRYTEPPDENCCLCACRCKVIPSRLPPLSTLSTSWMRRFHMLRLCSTLFPGLSLFGPYCNFSYARFLMACFQQTLRRSSACSHHCLIDDRFPSSSVYDSGNCNSSSMSNEYKQYVGCCLSVGCRRETETSGGNSAVVNAPESAYNTYDVAGECGVVDHRNADVNVSSNDNIELLPSQCGAVVLNHSITPCLPAADAVEDSDDDYDDDDDDSDAGTTESQNRDISPSSSLCTAPLLTMSRNTDENHTRWSFFIRASDSDASDCVDSDDDDDDMDAVSDDCWDDDVAADDNVLTHCTDGAQCFLIDLDPLRINGLYIPPTSNVPVSPSQFRCLQPLDSAAEIASDSMTTLKYINDTWQQCYSDDVKTRCLSQRHHTKHVRFSSKVPDQIVLPNDNEWEGDYRAARVGHWETLARDRERFMKRIEQTEQTISWIFAPQHRSKILSNLFGQLS